MTLGDTVEAEHSHEGVFGVRSYVDFRIKADLKSAKGRHGFAAPKRAAKF